MKKYAGIGSRKVPDDIGGLMTSISEKLCQKGYLLRSGGAEGSDKKFEKGVKLSVISGTPIYNKEIFTKIVLIIIAIILMIIAISYWP